KIEQGIIQEVILFIQKEKSLNLSDKKTSSFCETNISETRDNNVDKDGQELARLFSDAEITEESFDHKTDCYIKSLRAIVDFDHDSLKRTWRVWRPAWSPDIQGCSLSHKTGNDVSGGLLGRLAFKAGGRKKAKEWNDKRPHGQIHVHQGMEIYVLATLSFVFSYDEIKALIVKMIKASDFRKAVNENFMSTRGDEDKEFAWDFAYQLANSFDHGNDLLHTNMSERMYREIFLTPVIRSLFRKKSTDPDLFFGEICLYASAEDADLKKSDAEDRSSGRKIDAVWATKPPKVEFAICEVSGPPNQRLHSHYFTDKIKIGKMLKIVLNRIARVYGGDSTIFNLLKLYALQINDHNAIVYEMTVPYRELYLFREVIRTELPTSQEMLCKSLSELREYIMEAGLHTPSEKIKASLFVTEMTYTPHQKRIIIKKK
ncbi:891_t:CDS:10, partial [Acaulospora morrowiae]